MIHPAVWARTVGFAHGISERRPSFELVGILERAFSDFKQEKKTTPRMVFRVVKGGLTRR